MADVTINDLPGDTSVGGGESIPAWDNGETKKIGVDDLKNFIVGALMASGTGTASTSSLIVKDNEGNPKTVSFSDFADALTSFMVSLSGEDEQTISSAKTFTGDVKVKAPIENENPATKKYVDDADARKVDKVEGKGLSANDFTDALLQKLNGISEGAEANAVDSVNAKTGAVVLSASDVGAASQTPTYTKAASLSEPSGSGETTETIFGKLWKAVADYIEHKSSSSIHVTASDKQAWNGKQDGLSDAQNAAVNSGATSTKVSGYDAHVANQQIHVTASEKAGYGAHVQNASIHVTAADKSRWDSKTEPPTVDAGDGLADSKIYKFFGEGIGDGGVDVTVYTKEDPAPGDSVQCWLSPSCSGTSDGTVINNGEWIAAGGAGFDGVVEKVGSSSKTISIADPSCTTLTPFVESGHYVVQVSPTATLKTFYLDYSNSPSVKVKFVYEGNANMAEAVLIVKGRTDMNSSFTLENGVKCNVNSCSLSAGQYGVVRFTKVADVVCAEFLALSSVSI